MNERLDVIDHQFLALIDELDGLMLALEEKNCELVPVAHLLVDRIVERWAAKAGMRGTERFGRGFEKSLNEERQRFLRGVLELALNARGRLLVLGSDRDQIVKAIEEELNAAEDE